MTTSPAPVTLVTPCTVNQLVEFVNHVVEVVAGSTEAGVAGTVTTSSSLITVTP